MSTAAAASTAEGSPGGYRSASGNYSFYPATDYKRSKSSPSLPIRSQSPTPPRTALMTGAWAVQCPGRGGASKSPVGGRDGGGRRASARSPAHHARSDVKEAAPRALTRSSRRTPLMHRYRTTSSPILSAEAASRELGRSMEPSDHSSSRTGSQIRRSAASSAQAAELPASHRPAEATAGARGGTFTSTAAVPAGTGASGVESSRAQGGSGRSGRTAGTPSGPRVSGPRAEGRSGRPAPATPAPSATLPLPPEDLSPTPKSSMAGATQVTRDEGTVCCCSDRHCMHSRRSIVEFIEMQREVRRCRTMLGEQNRTIDHLLEQVRQADESHAKLLADTSAAATSGHHLIDSPEQRRPLTVEGEDDAVGAAVAARVAVLEEEYRAKLGAAQRELREKWRRALRRAAAAAEATSPTPAAPAVQLDGGGDGRSGDGVKVSKAVVMATEQECADLRRTVKALADELQASQDRCDRAHEALHQCRAHHQELVGRLREAEARTQRSINDSPRWAQGEALEASFPLHEPLQWRRRSLSLTVDMAPPPPPPSQEQVHGPVTPGKRGTPGTTPLRPAPPLPPPRTPPRPVSPPPREAVAAAAVASPLPVPTAPSAYIHQGGEGRCSTADSAAAAGATGTGHIPPGDGAAAVEVSVNVSQETVVTKAEGDEEEAYKGSEVGQHTGPDYQHNERVRALEGQRRELVRALLEKERQFAEVAAERTHYRDLYESLRAPQSPPFPSLPPLPNRRCQEGRVEVYPAMEAEVMQRKSGGIAPRSQVNDLEPTGFPVQPMQVLIGCGVFVVSVILMHFFVKATGGK